MNKQFEEMKKEAYNQFTNKTLVAIIEELIRGMEEIDVETNISIDYTLPNACLIYLKNKENGKRFGSALKFVMELKK